MAAKDDGTDRLCNALYGRKAKASDYLGGSNATMLHVAADQIDGMNALLERIINWSKEADNVMNGLCERCRELAADKKYVPGNAADASVETSNKLASILQEHEKIISQLANEEKMNEQKLNRRMH